MTPNQSGDSDQEDLVRPTLDDAALDALFLNAKTTRRIRR
jgi:hypothetical protein